VAVSYLHGIETIELTSGVQPVSTVKSSVIGLIGTAPDADTAAFPLNTPVAIFSDVLLANRLGKTGTLLDAVNAIFAQGAAVIVVVRVAEGTSEAESWSALVGDPVAKTGVWAFLNSRSILKIIPKILVAPGFTSDRPTNGVSGANLTAGGTGYDITTTATVSAAPAGGRTALASVDVVGGAVVGVTISDPGFGYTGAAPTITIHGPTGASGAVATATLGHVANPVGVALASIVDRLRAIALLDGPGTNYNDSVSYRDDYGSQRVMVIDPGVLKFDTNLSAYVVAPASAYAAGIQAAVDAAKGFWFPFSNNVINDIGGPARPIDYMINDANSEANILNENQVTTIIHDDGYRFWGLRGTGDDDLWAQLSVRRTADMVYESLETAMRSCMDKPFSYALLRFIMDSVNSYLAQLVERGALIGGKCWIDPTQNTAATFAGGELYVNFDIEPAASLEHLIFQASRNPNYYNSFVETFATSITGQ
jgi:hypothetical protein